ncbi:MAG: LysM peptidoglycan-binding domain-containing M23 family metallopeptidase [Candidatus Omnitrophota bacterium]
MKLIVILLISITLTGCATAPRVVTQTPLPHAGENGIYHEVALGETIWRIAKSYNVDVAAIARVNRLQDTAKIEVGQKLFIPLEKIEYDIPEQDIADIPSEAGFIWPVKGRVISYFGQKRHNAVNDGIDISSSDGELVVASKDGVVTFCDDKVKGFGKTVIIDHENGYSTVYAYNSLNLTKAGDRVKQNQPIGKVGKSSRSDNYALHFEIRKRQKAVNPFYYLP